MRGSEVLSDPEALPEGEPGFAVAPPPAPPPPVAAGPSHVPSASPGDRYTSLSPDEAQRRLGQMLATQGWSVTASAPGRFDVALSVPGDPNTLIGVLLLLLWLLPGIIYFLAKRRPTRVRATITFVPAEGGTRIAIQGSTDALQRLGPTLMMLPW
jgi:hypothetical protein